MSEDEKPNEINDYFTIEIDKLEVGSEIPFDCFMYLEKNQKVLHWLRQGSIFGPEKKEKVMQLENFEFLVKNTQKQEYTKYLKVHQPGSESLDYGKVKNADIEAPRVFGKVKMKIESPQPNIRPEKASGQAATKVKVDAEFLNIIITSTVFVFNDLCNVPVKLKSSTKRLVNSPSLLEVDVASFVALSSQSIRGTVGLCFPEKTYLYLLNQATGLEFSKVNMDLAMGAGEFMYQIFETARPNLTERGYAIDRAVPSLVADKNLSIPHVMPDPGFSVLFDSPGGQFQFEIGIKTGG